MSPPLFHAFLSLLILTSISTACRPNASNRSFTSAIIDNVVANITSKLADPAIAKIFECTYPNTVDTTVNYSYNATSIDDIDTFVITGDINAMWLRDSTWQLNGYLQYVKAVNDSSYNPDNQHLYNMLYGVHNRHMNSILIDVYANAFNQYNNSNGGGGPHQNDYRIPPMNRQLFEGKYELDSLCSVLHFTNSLYAHSLDASLISNPKWKQTVNAIYDAMKYQQLATYDENANDTMYYAFSRQTNVSTDTLLHTVGPPGSYTGMIKSAFRPSDDALRLPFNIAANAFAVVELRRTAQLFLNILRDKETNEKLLNLADEIEAGIQEFGVLNDNYYLYEVDGYGSHYFMDDGNVPSLLSLPYLGYVSVNDTVYRNTRSRLLSDKTNPYYFSGRVASGIGSPHTHSNWVWPMSIIMQIMTSNNDTEIMHALDVLKSTTANTNFMHESFDKDDAMRYTRSWFAWCNNLFGAMILQLIEQRPWLVLK